MGCPPVREDNPRAIAIYTLMYRWTNMVLLFHTIYTSIDLAHHEIFCAKIGKGGIRGILQIKHGKMTVAISERPYPN